MQEFVNKQSIVRQIWGKPDTILFIFAAASAEFALNKAVDWLFYTGRLPADPLGRLFSTVAYARQIVFSSENASLAVIDRMAVIHQGVEQKRGFQIPDWAYRDVLYMLIDYSIRSYELLYTSLNRTEKEEVYAVFRRVGERMGVPLLPLDYSEFVESRERQLHQDLEKSQLTQQLFKQYKAHLGTPRYLLLLLAQSLVVPKYVRRLLGLRQYWLSKPLVVLYRIFRFFNLDWHLKKLILPYQYVDQVRAMQVA